MSGSVNTTETHVETNQEKKTFGENNNPHSNLMRTHLSIKHYLYTCNHINIIQYEVLSQNVLHDVKKHVLVRAASGSGGNGLGV